MTAITGEAAVPAVNEPRRVPSPIELYEARVNQLGPDAGTALVEGTKRPTQQQGDDHHHCDPPGNQQSASFEHSLQRRSAGQFVDVPWCPWRPRPTSSSTKECSTSISRQKRCGRSSPAPTASRIGGAGCVSSRWRARLWSQGRYCGGWSSLRSPTGCVSKSCW